MPKDSPKERKLKNYVYPWCWKSKARKKTILVAFGSINYLYLLNGVTVTFKIYEYIKHLSKLMHTHLFGARHFERNHNFKRCHLCLFQFCVIEVAISCFQWNVNKVSFRTDDGSDRCAIAANKITFIAQ